MAAASPLLGDSTYLPPDLAPSPRYKKTEMHAEVINPTFPNDPRRRGSIVQSIPVGSRGSRRRPSAILNDRAQSVETKERVFWMPRGRATIQRSDIHPQPGPPMPAARKRQSSDIHGFERGLPKNQPLPPPRRADPEIHGGAKDGIFGYRSNVLRQVQGEHEEQRLRNAKKTSFHLREQQRIAGKPFELNVGNPQPTEPSRRRYDTELHGGAKRDANFFGESLQRESKMGSKHPKRQSWNLQDRRQEMRSKKPPEGTLDFWGSSPRSPRPSCEANGAYNRSHSMLAGPYSSIHDQMSTRKMRGLPPPMPSPRTQNVIHGYSAYKNEYLRHSEVGRNRDNLLNSNSFRDYERQSRLRYREARQELDNALGRPELIQATKASKRIGRSKLRPVAPMGIYQWPNARQWGSGSAGWAT
jgi:hypothetical protein